MFTLIVAASLCGLAPPQTETGPGLAEPERWWRQDPLFRQIAARLDQVPAIDNHTHLLWGEQFNPKLDPLLPLGLRSSHPGILAVLVERYGVPPGTPLPEAVERARAERRRRLERAGEAAYWSDHLDYTRTEIALVNQDMPAGTDARRLRWVPMGTHLLYPLPAESFMARNPEARSTTGRAQEALRGWLAEAGRTETPADLAGYARFAEDTLARWKQKGAVAVKFFDAYLRTLRFEDVPEPTAARLYAEGRSRPLSREEYLAVQDYLVRRLFLRAGELKLPVHIHSSHGVPPFLRLHESDVRNLDLVLTDPRFFGTSFVLVHGGVPLVEEAAYLGVKPHVWLDVSAQSLLYPIPDLAANLRKYLLWAPENVLLAPTPPTALECRWGRRCCTWSLLGHCVKA